MTNQDQRFQHRWELRRTETDLDSSSDDDYSRPNNSSSDETKHMKQNLVTTQNHDEINTKKTTHQKEKLPSFNEPNKKLDQPAMKQEKKAKTKRKTSNYELARDDLRGHMESLVEEIITARKSLLSWLDTQLKSPSKDNNNVDNVSSNPSGTRKVQRKNTVRTKTPRKNPSSNKRNRATKVNQEDPENEKVEVPSKETKNVAVDEKLIKGKKSRVSVNKKKQKKAVEVEEGDQQSNKTVAAATVDNCLNSSSKVLPQKQSENNERAPVLEDGNDKDGGNHLQKKPDQRAQQNKDGNFAQKGMMSPTMGNENGFGFGMVPQSGGIRSMPNISNQYGLQYLSHENRMARMYGEHPHSVPVPVPVPGFGNHGFVGCYSGFNQHMKFNAQQGGVMGLQCPDIRRGAFNQGNMTNQ